MINELDTGVRRCDGFNQFFPWDASQEKKMEQQRAVQLLGCLKRHILAGGQVIVGYDTVAELLGIDGDMNGAFTSVGQVCSRLDLASFKAHLPMLALHWVRDRSGLMNVRAFAHPVWENFESEMRSIAAMYRWTTHDFDLLQAALAKLPGDCARALWQKEQVRAMQCGGNEYIRYNLYSGPSIAQPATG